MSGRKTSNHGSVNFVRACNEHPNGAVVYTFPNGEVKTTELKPIKISVLPELRKRVCRTPDAFPAFIFYRLNNAIYFAKVSKDMKMKTCTQSHCCGFCERCTAASDSNGGCAKVRDFHFEGHLSPVILSSSQKEIDSVIADHRWIEKYNFLKESIELFNVAGGDDSIVYACNQFQTYRKRKTYTYADRQRSVQSLVELVIESPREITSHARYRDFF